MVLIWQTGHSSGMRQGCHSQAGSLSGSTDPWVFVIEDVQTCQPFAVRTLIYVKWKTSGRVSPQEQRRFFFKLSFEIESCCVFQAGFDIMVFLPWLSKQLRSQANATASG